MSRTYQARGIVLKGMPLGEADRLVTILTPEYGLIRAVVPGARKAKSRLRGRSELFVVNDLLIVKGRSLDKVIQADTQESYPGLSRDAGKLAAGQYLAEIVLCLALSEQSQTELYELLNEHLRRLESLEITSAHQLLYAYLAHAVFHFLAIAGIAPQIYQCCQTRQGLTANFTVPHWRVGFSFEAGGLIDSYSREASQEKKSPDQDRNGHFSFKINKRLTALELLLLQQLGKKTLPQVEELLPLEKINLSLEVAWIRVERLLRDYAQYHLGRAFRAAALVDSLVSLDF